MSKQYHIDFPEIGDYVQLKDLPGWYLITDLYFNFNTRVMDLEQGDHYIHCEPTNNIADIRASI